MLIKWLLIGLRYLHALFGGLFALFILFLLVNSFVLTIYTVQGHSMDTTLHTGQRVAVSLISPHLSPPKRNSIIIVSYSGDTAIKFVKRVIGVPGDTVDYRGRKLQLGPDEYFVEGDNRSFSTDSRTYGPVTQDHIVGEVLGNYPDYQP